MKPAFDYKPCNHSNGNVVCDKFPLKEVQKAFKRSSFPRPASVKLILQPYISNERFIPEDIFGTKQILDISIRYPKSSCCDNKLQVDANAFRSTKSFTNNFTIGRFDCTLLDLKFLSGFDKLTQLYLHNIYNIHNCLPSLPPLPRLVTFFLKYCTGMNNLNIFPSLTNGLEKVRFYSTVTNIHTHYNDEIVDRIINWLLLSSANTLEEMTIINMDQMTRVPHKIPSFKALKNVWLQDNRISTIKSGSFSFSVPVSLLNIQGNRIREIEPGAFQGMHNNFIYIL